MAKHWGWVVVVVLSANFLALAQVGSPPTDQKPKELPVAKPTEDVEPLPPAQPVVEPDPAHEEPAELAAEQRTPVSVPAII